MFIMLYKKGASDGYRRPVLTSETTKRKKLSNMLLYNNLTGNGVQWMMDKTGYYIVKATHCYMRLNGHSMPGRIPFYGQ